MVTVIDELSLLCFKAGGPPLFLGYDAGTDGLSVVAINRQGEILGQASADYGYGEGKVIPNLPQGVMQQYPQDWEKAMCVASRDLWMQLRKNKVKFGAVCIGIGGMMHAFVRKNRKNLAPDGAPLWCDNGDSDIAKMVTALLGIKLPQRFTISRALGALSKNPNALTDCTGITTPAGWLAYRCTGAFSVGAGEASGMFPVDPATKQFSAIAFEKLLTNFKGCERLKDLLPKVVCAGDFIGKLNQHGAYLTGAPAGSLMVAPEGDQQCALAGSFIARPGDAALSVGTSVVVNLLAEKEIQKIYSGIDSLVDPMFQRSYMLWIKNGAGFWDVVMNLLSQARQDKSLDDTFAALMPLAFKAADEMPNCGGLNGLPFINSEPGLGFDKSGIALLANLTARNLTVGNLIHLAFVLPFFGILHGLSQLAAEGVFPKRLIVTGGLTKSQDYAGQMIADVLNLPVFIPQGAAEGTAYGAATLARFGYEKNSKLEYLDFMDKLAAVQTGTTYSPRSPFNGIYANMYREYLELAEVGRGIVESREE